MIARAMMHDPKILMLDEQTAGVYIEVRYQIWKFLEQINKQQGTTIVLTTHYLEEAEHLCKNLAIIHNGQIVKNCSMEEVLESSNHTNYKAEIEASKLKSINIKGAKIKFENDNNIHISISKSTISDVICQLSDKGISITKLINQPNKLETLFLELTGKNT
jgi:ABC-2 type transport system ATP-binding protein